MTRSEWHFIFRQHSLFVQFIPEKDCNVGKIRISLPSEQRAPREVLRCLRGVDNLIGKPELFSSVNVVDMSARTVSLFVKEWMRLYPMLPERRQTGGQTRTRNRQQGGGRGYLGNKFARNEIYTEK